jgi:hypothetical protein
MKLPKFLITTSIFALILSFAHAKTTREIYAANKDSIVLLIAYDKQGIPNSLGSGFYIAPNRIATNQHVIEGASRIIFRVIGSRKSKEVKRVVSRSASLDMAILEVDAEGKPVSLSETSPQIGDKVVAIGNPRGLEGSVSEGIISAVRKESDISILQTTTPISPGSSGGPLFSEDGRVIGVTTATLRDSQNLNFAIPVALFKKLEEKGSEWEPVVKDSVTKQKRGSAGVELISPMFDNPINANFEYSLLNTNRRTIKNISYLLIFRSEKGIPLHFITRTSKDIFPAGLAKRYKITSFNDSDNHDKLEGKMVAGQPVGIFNGTAYFRHLVKVELRILTFDYPDSAPEDNLLNTLN